MTASSPSCRRTVHYSGSVQGVGFRFTTQRIADRYRVTGYVLNLPDGRVELVAEGSPAEVGRFLAAVDKAMHGYVQERVVAEQEATGEFPMFVIRR